MKWHILSISLHISPQTLENITHIGAQVFFRLFWWDFRWFTFFFTFFGDFSSEIFGDSPFSSPFLVTFPVMNFAIHYIHHRFWWLSCHLFCHFDISLSFPLFWPFFYGHPVGSLRWRWVPSKTIQVVIFFSKIILNHHLLLLRSFLTFGTSSSLLQWMMTPNMPSRRSESWNTASSQIFHCWEKVRITPKIVFIKIQEQRKTRAKKTFQPTDNSHLDCSSWHVHVS